MFKELTDSLAHNLNALKNDVKSIGEVAIGLEREGLRINDKGNISQEPHPSVLGSSFTHPSITTDFAENLLEFVTAVYHSPEAVYEALDKIQAFVYQNLNDELIWPDSMPPTIHCPNDIPIAQFGTTNAGRMKSVYREGLANRYGEMMQTIAGIHFNFSLSDDFFIKLQKATNDTQSLKDFKSDRYLHLMRSVSRFGFIVPYFFGASPIMPTTFLTDNNKDRFDHFDEETVFVKNGTSLRLSDIGYNNNKCKFTVSFNSLNVYINNIKNAVLTPCDKVAHIPVKKDGHYYQISNHILQIENEYYASIRPKQVPKGDETLLCALNKRGIGYVELRTPDIMPTIATGISVETIRFLQAFLTTCLLTDADSLSDFEYELNQANLTKVATKGREKDLKLTVHGKEHKFTELLDFVLNWIRPVANILGDQYVAALENLSKLSENSDLTPSAKILKELEQSQVKYNDYCIAKAQNFKAQYLNNDILSEDDQHNFVKLAKESLERQKNLEAEPQDDFDDYLANYFRNI